MVAGRKGPGSLDSESEKNEPAPGQNSTTPLYVSCENEAYPSEQNSEPSSLLQEVLTMTPAEADILLSTR